MAKPKNKDKRSAGFSSEEEASQPVGQSWFFGIGINDYKYFPPLNNAVRDVEAILQLLREQYDIDEAKILTDGQATRRSILRKLEELSRKVKPDDKLLIYFSGHGYLSPGGLGFLNGRRWMAQNLNYDVGEGCWFYEDAPKNGEKYGRLYTWEAAKKACPPGWRLPTDEEWRALAMAHGGLWDGSDKGDPKKAYSALLEGGSSGFAALLGGYRGPSGSFNNLGSSGGYWSGTEKGTQSAWFYFFYSGLGELDRDALDKSGGRSCRCIQDS